MTDDSYNALLLVNPNSRQGSAADVDAGIQKLQEAGISVETVSSNDVAQTEKEISARHKNIDFVIVGGGDGTISSTAQSLYRYRLPFAILPLGTANDLARSLGVPTNLNEAFELILANNLRWIDLGSVNDHYFFNACHIGLGVSITHELTPELKKKWGVLSYCKAFLTALADSGEFAVELTVDQVTYRKRALELAVGNGRFYGGGNIVDEKSSIDDGLLRLSCIYPKTVWELLAISPLIRKGKQNQAERTFCVSGKEIKVKTPVRMEVDADGEPVTQTPAHFKVIAKALQVFAPLEENDNKSLLEKLKKRVVGE